MHDPLGFSFEIWQVRWNRAERRLEKKRQAKRQRPVILAHHRQWLVGSQDFVHTLKAGEKAFQTRMAEDRYASGTPPLDERCVPTELNHVAMASLRSDEQGLPLKWFALPA